MNLHSVEAQKGKAISSYLRKNPWQSYGASHATI